MYNEQESMKQYLKDIRNTGDIEKFKKIRDEYPHIHWHFLRYEKTKDTILHIACRLGQEQVVKFIADNYKPMVPDCGNLQFKNPLHEAAQFGYPNIAKMLLENGASVDALKRGDWTPLMLACTKINEENYSNNKSPENAYKLIKLLCDRGANVNFRNKDGWTALHLVARAGNVMILELLLNYNLKLDIATRNLRTALHIASLHGHKEFAKKLIELGSKIDNRDSSSNTPLHDSVLGGHFDVFLLLIENKADTFLRNGNYFNILDLAACQGKLEFIEYITGMLNFDINLCNLNGLTPIHCAAKHKQMDAYKYILKLGGSPNKADQHGRTAQDYLNI